MAAQVIDGKAAAAQLRAGVREEATAFTARHGFPPRLCVLIVGNNPASRAYVRTKTRMAAEAGIADELIELPEDSSTADLLARIEVLNRDRAPTASWSSCRCRRRSMRRPCCEAIAPTRTSTASIRSMSGAWPPPGASCPMTCWCLARRMAACISCAAAWAPTAWPAARQSSSAAPTSSASRWRPCCWAPTARSPSRTRAPATCPRSAVARRSWSRPWDDRK